MPDFRVADTAPEHPKLRAAGLAAFGLWAAAGAYSMRELTDGWVPDYWVQTWPGGKKQATALVQVGLWYRETRHSLPGYQFHDWTDYQRSASKVHEDREKGRDRARRSRERHGERSPERSPEPVGDGSALLGSSNGVTAHGLSTQPARGETDKERSTSRLPAEMAERSPEPDPHVRPESHDSRALTRALRGSSVGREGSSKQREGTRNGPPRCSDHADMPRGLRPPPCGACKQLRLDAERDAADQEQRVADERAAHRARVDACRLCDDRGMREVGDALARCTHPTLEAVS
jgi:hypothetical protein